MTSSKSTPWIIGTIFLSLMLLAGSWLLVISPRLDSAAEMTAQSESQSARIDLLRTQLVQLQADFANIDTLRGDLGNLRLQIPEGLAESDMMRQIDALALAAGVTVTAVDPGTSVLMAAPAPAATTDASAATDGAAAQTDGASATQDAAAAPDASGGVQGMYGVPVGITILGGYDQTLDFLTRLQTANPRLYLVTSIAATAQTEQGAADGHPALSAGSLETQISTLTYVVTPAAVAAPTPGETPALPTPAGQPNPFNPGS